MFRLGLGLLRQPPSIAALAPRRRVEAEAPAPLPRAPPVAPPVSAAAAPQPLPAERAPADARPAAASADSAEDPEPARRLSRRLRRLKKDNAAAASQTGANYTLADSDSIALTPKNPEKAKLKGKRKTPIIPTSTTGSGSTTKLEKPIPAPISITSSVPYPLIPQVPQQTASKAAAVTALVDWNSGLSDQSTPDTTSSSLAAQLQADPESIEYGQQSNGGCEVPLLPPPVPDGYVAAVGHQYFPPGLPIVSVAQPAVQKQVPIYPDHPYDAYEFSAFDEQQPWIPPQQQQQQQQFDNRPHVPLNQFSPPYSMDYYSTNAYDKWMNVAPPGFYPHPIAPPARLYVGVQTPQYQPMPPPTNSYYEPLQYDMFSQYEQVVSSSAIPSNGFKFPGSVMPNQNPQQPGYFGASLSPSVQLASTCSDGGGTAYSDSFLMASPST
ncbi:hypothetical protein BDR26DRAFT_850740, partial [Obelidium mucronatum]